MRRNSLQYAVRHVAIGRDDDRAHRRAPFVQFVEQREPVHDRHVDIEEHEVDVGFGVQRGQCLFAVMGEAECELLLADLAAKTLPDQKLEVGLVVDGKNLGGIDQCGALQVNGACSSRTRPFKKTKSTGLVTNSAAPYRRRGGAVPRRHRRSTSSPAGRERRFLISRKSDNPSIPGILMSERITISRGSISPARRSSASAAEAAKCRTYAPSAPRAELLAKQSGDIGLVVNNQDAYSHDCLPAVDVSAALPAESDVAELR